MRCFFVAVICIVFAISIGCASTAESSDESNSTESNGSRSDGMQEKCLNQTGSDAAYGSYLAAEQAFKKCLEADYASFVIDWENSTGSTPLLRKYCSTRVMIFKCVDDFAEAFQPCHTAEEQRTYEVILNATKVVIHFACENDGAQVIRFSENEGIDCGWERRIGLRQCAQLLAWKWPVLKGTVNPKLVASINARTWCDIFDTFGSCATVEFDQCTSPVPRQVLAALVEHIRTESACVQFNTTDLGTTAGCSPSPTLTGDAFKL